MSWSSSWYTIMGTHTSLRPLLVFYRCLNYWFLLLWGKIQTSFNVLRPWHTEPISAADRCLAVDERPVALLRLVCPAPSCLFGRADTFHSRFESGGCRQKKSLWLAVQLSESVHEKRNGSEEGYSFSFSSTALNMFSITLHYKSLVRRFYPKRLT